MTEPQTLRDPWIQPACPVCSAPTGILCRGPQGMMAGVHGERRVLGDELAERHLVEQEQLLHQGGCDSDG